MPIETVKLIGYIFLGAMGVSTAYDVVRGKTTKFSQYRRMRGFFGYGEAVLWSEQPVYFIVLILIKLVLITVGILAVNSAQ